MGVFITSFTWPPNRSERSNSTTWCPLSAATRAASIPAGPPPYHHHFLLQRVPVPRSAHSLFVAGYRVVDAGDGQIKVLPANTTLDAGDAGADVVHRPALALLGR